MMTNNEKEMIRELRMQGLGYGKVAERTGLWKRSSPIAADMVFEEKGKGWRKSMTKITSMYLAKTVERKSGRNRNGKRNSSAVMPAVINGGISILIR